LNEKSADLMANLGFPWQGWDFCRNLRCGLLFIGRQKKSSFGPASGKPTLSSMRYRVSTVKF
jgi:hypothetical protein